MRKAFAAILLLLFLGCANVKPYHQAKLNHPEMSLGDDIMEIHETNSQNYREGASGAGGGKTGGGCGCN